MSLQHHDMHNSVAVQSVSMKTPFLFIFKGSFGSVVKATDFKTGSLVAVKIIRNKARFHKQGMIEIKILDELRKKDKEKKLNIIHMIDHFTFRNHLCITFELLG